MDPTKPFVIVLNTAAQAVTRSHAFTRIVTMLAALVAAGAGVLLVKNAVAKDHSRD